MESINKVRISVREYLNVLLGPVRTRRLRDPSFTIISNNCWGGHVYRYFGLPYSSPTVGLYSDDYIRFISNLRYYLSLELCFIQYEESKYKHILESRGETNIPIGLLGDVEIIFLHYKSINEARDKWNRRISRINWNHLIIKMSEMNLCSEELMAKFDALPFSSKILFTTHKTGFHCAVLFREYYNKPEITNDTLNFRRYINLINLINGDK